MYVHNSSETAHCHKVKYDGQNKGISKNSNIGDTLNGFGYIFHSIQKKKSNVL